MKLKIVQHYLLNSWYNSHLYSVKKLGFLQQKRLQILRKTLAKSPFYKKYKDTPLYEIPLTNKAHFMAHFDEINTLNIQKETAFEIAYASEKSRDFSSEINGITVGLSSGTSGNRGIFLASKKERALWVANVFSKVIAWSWKRRKVAFFLRANSNLYEAVKSKLIEFSFYDIQLPLAQLGAQIADYQPNIIVGQPSVLRNIVAYCREKNIQLQPQKVISVAEVLTPEDSQYLGDYFQQKIHQVYQCTEGFLAATCEEGVLHFNEDNLLIEKRYLDEDKTRFHPIITDFWRSSQPVVRYELNDIIVEGKPCKCGRKTTTIAAIEGRSDDIFRFKNKEGKAVTIYPDFIRRAVVFASEKVEEYVVIQRDMQQVDCYLKIAKKENEIIVQTIVKKALQALFLTYEIEDVSIRFMQEYILPKGEKMRRVRSDIKTAK